MSVKKESKYWNERWKKKEQKRDDGDTNLIVFQSND